MEKTSKKSTTLINIGLSLVCGFGLILLIQYVAYFAFYEEEHTRSFDNMASFNSLNETQQSFLLTKTSNSKRGVTLLEWNQAGSNIPQTEPTWKKHTWSDCYLFDSEFLKQDVSRVVMQYIHVNMVSVFEQFDIPYMIYAGTALGSVREHSYIKWTADVDTLIPFQVGYILDNSSEVQEALFDKGIIYFRDPKTSTDGVARMCLHKNFNLFPGAKGRLRTPVTLGYYISHFPYMDVYSAKEKKRGYFMVHQFRNEKVCSACYGFQTSKVFPLGECDINGNMFPCANQPKHMLERMYGHFWTKPTCHSWNDTTKKCAKWIKNDSSSSK